MSPRIVSGRVVATVIVSSGRLAARVVDQVVADRPERAGLRRRDDLEIRDARPAAGTPVDEALGAVGQAVVVELLEAHADRAGGALVHREPEAAPVRGGAEPPLLAQHHLARRVDELPHPLEVALPAERFPRLAVGRDDLVEDVLGGDRGVVQPRQPERLVALHPGVPDHRVLEGERERVAEVQRAGDVRWRLDDHERRQRRVGAGARCRRARRRRPRASGRRSRPRSRPGPRPSAVLAVAPVPPSLACSVIRCGPPSCREHQTPRSSSGRTGSWYHLLVRGPAGRSSRLSGFGPGLLVARYRAPAARLASDVHARVPARLAPSRARSVAPVGATPLGRCREGGSVHRPGSPPRVGRTGGKPAPRHRMGPLGDARPSRGSRSVRC